MLCTPMVVVMSALVAPRPAHPSVVSQFVERTCESPQGSLSYRIYEPPNAGPNPLPLVIWFHGRGEAGTDNESQLAWLELVMDSERSAKPRLLILAYQFSSEQNRSPVIEHVDPSWIAELDLVMAHVLDHHAVDAERVLLAGISQGANRCWQYAIRHPGRFAAMLPMATGAVSDAASHLPLDLAVWAFQSQADGAVQQRRLGHLIQAMRERGGVARLSIVPSHSHDCWTSALRDYGAWDWLMDQRRGRRASSLPRVIGGRYWSERQIRVMLGVGVAMAGIIGGGRWLWRYRFRRESQAQSEDD